MIVFYSVIEDQIYVGEVLTEDGITHVLLTKDYDMWVSSLIVGLDKLILIGYL